MKSANLFNWTNVWTIHLTFTPEQWQAMEPKGGDGGAMGGRGGPGGFGPGMFLGPAFLEQADLNKDGKLAKSEFHALAERWFGEWDKNGNGQLDGDQLRAGLNASFGGGGPGGPRGAGGRGPGFNLQGPEGKRNGLASAIGLEFEYVHADLEFEGTTLKNVGVRYKGNGTFMQSRDSNKRSMKVDLNRYVKGQKLGNVATLNLHNNVTDASWMNEPLSHRLFRDAGVPAPRTAYARVFVTVPGKYEKSYLGLYSLVENLDTHFEQEYFGTKKGAIFKPVTPDLFADLGNDWAKYKQTYDPKTEVSEKQSARVMEFCRLVSKAPDGEFAAKLGDYLDLEEFARFMAVTTWLSTMDSILGMGQNFLVYLNPKIQKFQFMPWDLDHSFGQFVMTGTQEQRENLSIQKPWRGDVRFLRRVFQVEAFKTIYLAKLREFSNTLFEPDRISRQVDEVAAAIRPAVQAESTDKLARFDKVTAGEPVEPNFRGFGPPGGGRGGGFGPGGGGMAAAKPIKGFVAIRAQSVKAQLAGKSEGESMENTGFGPGGGGGGGPRGGGRGGPGPGGPGNFLAPAFVSAFDTDKNGQVSKSEFLAGFDNWFTKWDKDKSGLLTEEQLRSGINEDIGFRGGPQGDRPPQRP